MERKKSLSVTERNRSVLSLIESIKTEHPFWDYRRCWAYLYLYYRQGLIVNKKRIYRLMKENGLLVTKIKIGCWGWYYLVLVLDWYTKKIIGYSLSLQSKSRDWKEALCQAVQKRFPEGIKDSLKGTLYLVSDNGCQLTSLSYMQAWAVLGISRSLLAGPIPKEMPIPNG